MQGISLSSRRRVVRSAALIALVASVAALAACGSDNNGSTGPANVTGTYSLVSIDGHPLPYQVPNVPDHTIVVTSGTIVLNSDHSYTVGGTGTSDGGDPQQVIADAGTYVAGSSSGSGSSAGSNVTFTSTAHPPAVYSAQATSTTLTATAPGGFAGSTNTSFALVLDKTT